MNIAPFPKADLASELARVNNSETSCKISTNSNLSIIII
jgi:hypothetical protein